MALLTTLKLADEMKHFRVGSLCPGQKCNLLVLWLKHAFEVNKANSRADTSLHGDVFRILSIAERTWGSINGSGVNVNGWLLFWTTVILFGLQKQLLDLVKTFFSVKSVVAHLKLPFQFGNLLVFIVFICVAFSCFFRMFKSFPCISNNIDCDVWVSKIRCVCSLCLLRPHFCQLVVNEEVELIVFRATIFEEIIQFLLALVHAVRLHIKIGHEENLLTYFNQLLSYLFSTIFVSKPNEFVGIHGSLLHGSQSQCYLSLFPSFVEVLLLSVLDCCVDSLEKTCKFLVNFYLLRLLFVVQSFE